MFERFSDQARRVVIEAQQEAQSLGHHHIGTEHLLLALAAIESDTFGDCDVSADRIREVVRREFPPTPGEAPAQTPFTAEAKKTLELSLREALRLDSNEIRTGHLLLGLLADPEGTALRVLDALDVQPRRLRGAALLRLAEERTSPARGGGGPVHERLDEISAKLDEVLRRIEAIERRMDR